MESIVLIAHNVRSTHNVGSLLRTAEGLGINKVWLTGFTPYPKQSQDARLPHLAEKIDKQIQKTALGAEVMLDVRYEADVSKVIGDVKAQGYRVVGLEQTPDATKLQDYKSSQPVALIVGNEIDGIDPQTLKLCDECVVIPMQGQKESFNVVQATAMALYHLTFRAQ